MGSWLINKDAVTVSPKADEDLIMNFISFCVEHNPYESIGENFPCTWFFTKDNKLTSYTGKFAEPSVWYRLLVDGFFKPRGYTVGEPEMIQDMNPVEFGRLNSSRIEEFIDWKYRILEIAVKRCGLLEEGRT